MRLSIQALAAAITRFALMLSLAFTLTQRAAVAAIPPPSPHLVLDLPPHAVCQPFARTLSGDLSAGVRMHRGDKTLDVWLLTPLTVLVTLSSALRIRSSMPERARAVAAPTP